jgi:hypothetical protein
MLYPSHGSYKWIIMHEKCGRPDSNGFLLKWRFGTHGRRNVFFFLMDTRPHCAFSSNLFHRQIVQIAILQLSDPENKKCSPWKVFERSHPQTLRLLSRRGPRSRDRRLSQHYIGPKMTFCHFLNFCRKKFSGMKIKLLSCGKHSIRAGNFF